MASLSPLQTTWKAFCHRLIRDILPIYQHHKQTFDPWEIHGVAHILRSLLLADRMAEEYKVSNQDRAAIWFAVAFHDSGRQDNGEDLWECDSAENCFQYLRSMGLEEVEAQRISNWIVKDGPPECIPEQICHDADCLEIMRLTGLEGFVRGYLYFDLDGREELIQSAWDLVNLSSEELMEVWRQRLSK